MEDLKLNKEEVEFLIEVIEHGNKSMINTQADNEALEAFIRNTTKGLNTEESIRLNELLDIQRENNKTFRRLVDSIITKLHWLKNELIQ